MVYRLIAGLGNPGPEYADTRHNAGFWFIDALARDSGSVLGRDKRFAGELGRLERAADCRLLKPDTFMNASGRSVAAVAAYFRIAPAQILVVHDELDLQPGVVRLKRGGGHGGHNGLRDITTALGGNGFDRLRIGIGRPPGGAAAVTPWVLGRPAAGDREAMEAAIDRAVALLPALLDEGPAKVMNRLHRDEP